MQMSLSRASNAEPPCQAVGSLSFSGRFPGRCHVCNLHAFPGPAPSWHQNLRGRRVGPRGCFFNVSVCLHFSGWLCYALVETHTTRRAREHGVPGWAPRCTRIARLCDESTELTPFRNPTN